MRTRETRATMAAALVGLALAACPRPGVDIGSGQAGRPNVVLVSIDTLRPDHLGCYGYDRDTSPTIDRLAAEGVVFDNHISSSSWTLPAHAALLTGLVDSLHGCTDTDRLLIPGRITLAEVLRDAGYVTAGFFSGPYLHPAFGFGQGFDRYVDCTSYRAALDHRPVSSWAMDPGVLRRAHRDITNPAVSQAVVEWLDSVDRDAPFFLFVHMWDVHFDFIPPPPFDSIFDPDYEGWVTGEDVFFDPRVNSSMAVPDREHLIALYDGEIRWTDTHLGYIMAALDSASLLARSLVVVTSDHGTEFFEHGEKGHRTSLFDEVIRIPLVLRYPSRLPRGVRVHDQTRIIDLAATVLELAGVARPEGFGMGASLVPLALGKSGRAPMAISELFSVGYALRSARSRELKLLHDLGDDSLVYFDLVDDPGEQTPRRTWDGASARALLDAYRGLLTDLETRAEREGTSSAQPQIPAEVREQLEGLGYIRADGD